MSFVEYLNKNRTALHSPPIYITGEKENATLEIALQYNDTFIENIFPMPIIYPLLKEEPIWQGSNPALPGPLMTMPEKPMSSKGRFKFCR